MTPEVLELTAPVLLDAIVKAPGLVLALVIWLELRGLRGNVSELSAAVARLDGAVDVALDARLSTDVDGGPTLEVHRSRLRRG